MDKTIPVYQRIRLSINSKGDVYKTEVGPQTCNLLEAETWRSQGVDFDFDTRQIDANWREGAAISETVLFMREAAELVHADIERSLA